MADSKISLLDTLAKGSVDPDADFLAIVDTDLTTTKKATPEAVVSDALLDLHVDTTDPASSAEVAWPTAHASTGPLLISTGETGSQTDGTGNPTIRVGYNLQTNSILKTGNFGAAWCIEGHWDSDAAGDYLMEAYCEFGDTSDATYRAQRPFMATYDESESLINLCKLQIGTGYTINFNETDTTSAGNTFATFKQNATNFLGDNNANNVIGFYAGTARNLLWRFSCNGDDLGTHPTMRWSVAPWGGGTDRQVAIYMGDGSTSTTGAVTFRYETSAGYSAPLVNIGATNSVTTALFSVDHANVPTSIHTAQLIAKASQTGAVLNVDGIASAGTTEANKWQLFPKGSISVKPSGGAVTAPTAGSGGPTALPTVANKPGTAIASCTATWFPMLDATGALFWVPGWSA